METINHYPASWAKVKNSAAIWLHPSEMRWVRYSYWQMRKGGLDEWTARCNVLRLLRMGKFSKNSLDWQREKREREYRNSVMRDAF